MIRSRILTSSILGLIILLFYASCVQISPEKLRIALSKGSPDTSYANYYNWVHNLDSTVVCIDMYAMSIDSALDLFRGCSGLILTGGTDINPALYNKAYDTVRCWPIDNKRDELEIRLLDSAIAWNKPVLGICRGSQLINVAFGGSLVVDIPQDRPNAEVHQCDDYLNCFHDVRLTPNSRLSQISGVRQGEVTTNHHQAVDALGKDLMMSAYTAQGIPEAIEWADTASRPFLIGVQWHPERMELDDPLSGAIGRRFLEECRKTVRL
jgi:putative glutamine amidotransferase